MDEQVQFKAYMFWAENSKPEVRRFGVDKSVVSSFQYLTAKLLDLFPGLREKRYSVTWKDEDGDEVTISSDEELVVALVNNRETMAKLYIHVKDVDSKSGGGASEDEACDFFAQAFEIPSAAAQAGVPSSGIPHVGVVCDACEGPVVGFRYKCASCPDFDLCARCEAAGLHNEHCMVRVPLPMMPRHLIKAAIKRSRHFLKNVPTEECPYKKRERERSGDRKHNRREHGDRRERRQRSGWLDTVALLNKYVNLVGDDLLAPCAAQKDNTPRNDTGANSEGQGQGSAEKMTQDEPTAQTSAQSEATPNSEQAQATAGPSAPEFRPELILDKLLNPENVKYIVDIQKTLTSILYPNLEPQTSAATSTPPPTPANENSAPNYENATPNNANSTPNNANPTPNNANPTPNNANPTPNNEQEMEVEKDMQKEPSPDKVSVTSVASSSSYSTDKEDKTDGWTVINKENDLMDAAGKPTPSAPEPMVPIGFDLPAEFQKRVSTNPAQIYPPLHTATAVLDPVRETLQTPIQPQQVPIQPQPAQAQPMPAQTQLQPAQAQPKPAPTQPQPQPRPRHPKPHIEAAIQHMLAMGFNNDSGWLTQLLETKDGNISAVLDLLTPVSVQRK